MKIAYTSRHRMTVTLAMLYSGAVVAIVPASVQAIASRLFTINEQASIAIALSAGAFISVIVNAILLESRLANPSIRVKTYVPIWLTILGLAACIALATGLPLFIACGIPVLMTALQLGRTHAAISDLWRSELVSGTVLFLGCAGGIALAIARQPFAFGAVALSAIAVLLIRQINGRSPDRDPVPVRTAMWVGAETTVVASTPFLLNLTVLAALGPADAVAFRLVLTVLGVLQPILGYLRTKLLGTHSTRLVIFLSALSIFALAALLVVDKIGIFRLFFGDTWQYVTFASLVIACIWKAVSIPANIPFAHLRRQGKVHTVFYMRAISTAAYVALGVTAALLTRSNEAVFVAFTIAELATFVLYEAAYRRGLRESRAPNALVVSTASHGQ